MDRESKTLTSPGPYLALCGEREREREEGERERDRERERERDLIAVVA